LQRRNRTSDGGIAVNRSSNISTAGDEAHSTHDAEHDSQSNREVRR
jgi:hypothetical protein